MNRRQADKAPPRHLPRKMAVKVTKDTATETKIFLPPSLMVSPSFISLENVIRIHLCGEFDIWNRKTKFQGTTSSTKIEEKKKWQKIKPTCYLSPRILRNLIFILHDCDEPSVSDLKIRFGQIAFVFEIICSP